MMTKTMVMMLMVMMMMLMMSMMMPMMMKWTKILITRGRRMVKKNKEKE